MAVGLPTRAPIRSIEETLDDLMEIRQFIERFRTRAPASSASSVHEAQATLNRVIADVRDLNHGYVHRQPAHDADASLMIHAKVADVFRVQPRHDRCRSPWFWLTMPNGDLLIGSYPQDDFCDEIRARIALRDTGPFL